MAESIVPKETATSSIPNMRAKNARIKRASNVLVSVSMTCKFLEVLVNQISHLIYQIFLNKSIGESPITV